jgi:hypothetical protein
VGWRGSGGGRCCSAEDRGGEWDSEVVMED